MAQVFISYSSAEADQANELVKKLEQAGIQCWIAPRDIPMGSDYTDEIPEAIEACPTFLLLLSKKSQASKWVKMELTQALNDNRYILPLQMEDFTPKKGFTFLLQNAQIRPYYSNPQGTLDEAIQKIRQYAPQPPAPKPAVQSKPEPAEIVDPTTLTWDETAEYTDEAGNPVTFATEIPKEAADLAAKLFGPKKNNLSAEECYRKGKAYLDTEKYSDAVIWLRKAADLGHRDAQYWLGDCYQHGYGVPKNTKDAVALFRKAAEQGKAAAQNRMGTMYRYGIGVPKDLTEARKWYTKAAAQGFQTAIDAMKEL